ELGIDPALVDPLRVLASVAGDATAPASARVAAARALLAARDPARNRRPSNGKAEGKKALAARAAATAGRGAGGGDDLGWPGGAMIWFGPAGAGSSEAPRAIALPPQLERPITAIANGVISAARPTATSSSP